MNGPRPGWEKRLRFWLTDGQYDLLPDDASEWAWWWRAAFELAVVRGLLCGWYGHEPGPDQCNRPEHDRCAYCLKPMPFKAGRTA